MCESAILSIAVVAVLVSAAMWPLLPRWTAVAPSWLAFRQAPVAAAPDKWSAARISDEPEFAAADVRRAPAHSASRRIDFRPWLIPMIWFVGAAVLLIRFAVNLSGLRRLREASEPVTGAQLPVRLWRNESGFRRRSRGGFSGPSFWCPRGSRICRRMRAMPSSATNSRIFRRTIS